MHGQEASIRTGRSPEPLWNPLPSRSRRTRLSPTKELQKSSRPRITVERSFDVATEEPPLGRRIGKTAVRNALNFDHSERPELIAMRLKHSVRNKAGIVCWWAADLGSENVVNRNGA